MSWNAPVMLVMFLILYAGAWYETLTARSAAIRAGGKRLQSADLGLIAGLTLLPFGLVMLFFA